MKKISILGSTGSIGTQAIDVIRRQNHKVVALAAFSNVSLLLEQAKLLYPSIICVYKESAAQILKEKLKKEGLINIEVVSNEEGLIKVASQNNADLVINALVGMVGLKPTLKAIENHKDVAIANKESIVTGGELINKLAIEKNVKILPIDSEHSAIFQSIDVSNKKEIKRILLTASGGVFFGKTKQELEKVTVSQAIKNPNWDMGKKVSIDSATLMNKGLELIEASKLFNISPKKIEVLIHKESVLHSAVEYNDSSIIGQLAIQDMRIPINYAINYPKRQELKTTPLDLTKIGTLSFFSPDREVFSCLSVCEEAASLGGYYPTLVNGANEEAVSLFLKEKISFLDIFKAVKEALKIKVRSKNVNLNEIMNADKEAKDMVRTIFNIK